MQKIMRKDAGVAGDAQRIEQLGWMLFLKIFSDLEEELELTRDGYRSPVPEGLRWHSWADSERLGKDSLTGDALLAFVDGELFPTLKGLDLAGFEGEEHDRAAIIRSVFEDAHNYMKSGTLMRQVIDRLQSDIDFNQAKTRHLFGEIYEQILTDLQGAGNAGEFYTPRAVTQFAVDLVNPQLGEVVLDPACGTGGFLTCAYEHMKRQVETTDEQALLERSVRGIEKKGLPHLLCVTNMMVHGIAIPSHIRHGNTLTKPLRDYGPKDQVDVIVTNPPFGGMEEDGIENNFPSEFRTRETADLFLVLVMELLKDGGRAAIVLPDGTLFGEGIKTRIKEKLLRDCNLHTIVRLPKGVFQPYTPTRTNILFFTKGEPTKEIWYYEHPYPEGYKSYSKTKPIRIEEFDSEKAWWEARQSGERAWLVPIGEVVERGYNLDISHPDAGSVSHDDPDELLRDLAAVRLEIDRLRATVRTVLEEAMES